MKKNGDCFTYRAGVKVARLSPVRWPPIFGPKARRLPRTHPMAGFLKSSLGQEGRRFHKASDIGHFEILAQ